MKEYSKGIYVKFKPEEVEILHDRMKEAGVQNMSAYIRKMAINGYVIIPEWPDLNWVISLHARISNNLNQYAKKANETGKQLFIYMRKIQRRESELIKSVSVALRFIRSSRGLGAQDVRWTAALHGPEWNGDLPKQAKMRRVYTGALLANL